MAGQIWLTLTMRLATWNVNGLRARLEYVLLGRTDVTDLGIAALRECPRLRALDASGHLLSK